MTGGTHTAAEFSAHFIFTLLLCVLGNCFCNVMVLFILLTVRIIN